MRYRTAVKTGRAPMQALAPPTGPFSRYVAMVERLSVDYVRPLKHRLPQPRRAP